MSQATESSATKAGRVAAELIEKQIRDGNSEAIEARRRMKVKAALTRYIRQRLPITSVGEGIRRIAGEFPQPVSTREIAIWLMSFPELSEAMEASSQPVLAWASTEEAEQFRATWREAKAELEAEAGGYGMLPGIMDVPVEWCLTAARMLGISPEGATQRELYESLVARYWTERQLEKARTDQAAADSEQGSEDRTDREASELPSWFDESKYYGPVKRNKAADLLCVLPGSINAMWKRGSRDVVSVPGRHGYYFVRHEAIPLEKRKSIEVD